MHIDFMAEGWLPDLEQLELWLNTRTFPMKIIDKEGKESKIIDPVTLRPRRFYKYVFPRENLD